MIFINDEKLQEVVSSLYYDNDNNCHRGIYQTCDDAWLLVNINVLEKLLYQGVVISHLDIKDAEAVYGDAIIQRYLARQEQSSKSNSLKNLDEGRRVHKRSSEVRKAKIIASIIQGHTKEQIESEVGVCRSTIDKILRDLRQGELLDLFNKYRESLFSEVSGSSFNDFMSVDCSYSKYHKLLQSR